MLSVASHQTDNHRFLLAALEPVYAPQLDSWIGFLEIMRQQCQLIHIT